MLSPAQIDHARSRAHDAQPISPQGRAWLAALLQPSTTHMEQDPTP